jgi:hypothetical protein
MMDFLVSVLRYTWPIHLVALAGAEILLFLRMKTHWRGFAGASVCLFFVLLLAVLFADSSAISQFNGLADFFLVYAQIVIIPLVFMVAGVMLVAKLENRVARHGVLVSLVLATIFFLPLWALGVACSSTGDCV